ncbi:male sterility protein-domain-containing protein [Coprinopsis sp. MPI-PUGE-AT-0042]|nr:male sterility protein-domain-containing protein [Coprinopsis sp. MPI-PUGE-AT-0042]
MSWQEANISASPPISVLDDVVREMVDLVKANSTFEPPTPVPSISPIKHQGHVILLTGTTGLLGAYLLDVLLRDDGVAKVYAFNRQGRDSGSLWDRHVQGFLERGLDSSVLQEFQQKLQLVEGNLTQENFGVSEKLFTEMAASVTVVVHNAWPVNMGIPLKAFTSVIAGVNRLLSFAMASPLRPPVLFSSSFTVCQNAPATGRLLREASIPPQWSVATGYVRSKWVVEQLLAQASNMSGLQTLSVRVGQLCGGDNGFWRPEEWFPRVLFSSAHLGALPTNDRACPIYFFCFPSLWLSNKTPISM